MAALARPVRSVLNSRCSASMAPCMRCWMSLRTSFVMSPSGGERGRLVGDERSDRLSEEGAADVPLLAQRKNIDRNLGVAGHVDRRRVHHLQPLREYALVRHVREALRV